MNTYLHTPRSNQKFSVYFLAVMAGLMMIYLIFNISNNSAVQVSQLSLSEVGFQTSEMTQSSIPTPLPIPTPPAANSQAAATPVPHVAAQPIPVPQPVPTPSVDY